MVFRMHDGSRIRARIVGAGGLLSVHVDRDYDVPGVEWSGARTIVDIGAHVGSFTVWAALRSPQARLLAVEPNPDTFSLLRQNIVDNGLQQRVTAILAAVGDKPGTGRLELLEHSLGTRLASGRGGPDGVRVQTMVGLLAEAAINDVDVLKMDCEGMEYAVFEALPREWLQSIKVLACEYHPVPGRSILDLEAVLRSHGFRVQRPNARLGVIWASRS